LSKLTLIVLMKSDKRITLNTFWNFLMTKLNILKIRRIMLNNINKKEKNNLTFCFSLFLQIQTLFSFACVEQALHYFLFFNKFNHVTSKWIMYFQIFLLRKNHKLTPWSLNNAELGLGPLKTMLLTYLMCSR